MLTAEKLNWYVYRHIRLDKNEPFYIGIGSKKNYARAYEIYANKRNNIWSIIYNKTSIEVEILADNLSKEQASAKEQEFINLYGRINLKTGCLSNMTDGGDGIWNCKHSDETKDKIRKTKIGSLNPMYGKKRSESTLKKFIASVVGRKSTDETKNKQSLSSVKSGQAKKTAVYKYDTNELIGTYHSLSYACKMLNIPKSSRNHANKIANGTSGTRKQTKGYYFKYIN